MPACSGEAAGFVVAADARSYRVAIRPGAAEAQLRALGGDAVVIADAFFRERFAALPCPVLFVEAVEANKTLTEGARLIEAARARGLTRGGRIVAVGGGIVQDVATFVAATFMRGVAWEYLPTTVLGMVDSCIGGKASINVGRFKNIAGMIHPPDAILVDPDFALTLPMGHRAGGLCEAAKISFARGGDSFGRYLDAYEAGGAAGAGAALPPPALARATEVSLLAKRWFIETDEFDRAERLLLNYGHTFGHAIEAATGFAVDHGAAVGLGMLCAAHFAEEVGATGADPRLARRLATLEAHVLALLDAVPGLAAAFAAIDMAAFEAALLSDKKHGADHLALVLPVPDAPLPLALRRFPRDAATLRRVAATIPAAMGKLAR